MYLPLNKIAIGAGPGVQGFLSSNVGIDPATDILSAAKIQASGSFKPRTLEMRFAEIVNALDGVSGTAMVNDGTMSGNNIGDTLGGTDNTAAFQALLAYASNGKAIFIPPGDYFFADPNAAFSISLGYDKTLIFGVRGATRFLLGDNWPSTVASNFFQQVNFNSVTTQNLYSLFYMSGITFQSRWSQLNLSAWDPSTLNHFIFALQNYSEIIFDNIGIADLRGLGNRSQYNNSAAIRHSHFTRIARGSVGRFNDTNNIHIEDNTFRYMADDAVNPVSTGVVTPPRQFVSIGNTYFQTQGEVPAGQKLVIVANNSYMLVSGGAIAAGSGLNNGVSDTQNCLTLIVNNHVSDPIAPYDPGLGALDTYTAADATAGANSAGTTMTAATTAALPAWSNGSVVTDPIGLDTGGRPIPYNYNGTLESIAAAEGIILSNNVIKRTLGAIATFNSYGLSMPYNTTTNSGVFYNSTGWYNPAVADNNFAPHGIVLQADTRNAMISNNHVSGFRQGAALKLFTTRTADVTKAYGPLHVVANQMIDNFRGIDTDQNASVTDVYWPIKVLGNFIDCDPYLKNAQRTGFGTVEDGTWAASVAQANQAGGIVTAGVSGWEIAHNTIANCYQPLIWSTAFRSIALLADNVLICNPAATGYNAANVGIAVVPNAGPEYRFIIVGGNPHSPSTFRTLINMCLTSSNSIPTTGTYVQGAFVWNNAPVISGGKITLGWSRLTTGSAHVSGTDWQPVVV